MTATWCSAAAGSSGRWIEHSRGVRVGVRFEIVRYPAIRRGTGASPVPRFERYRFIRPAGRRLVPRSSRRAFAGTFFSRMLRRNVLIFHAGRWATSCSPGRWRRRWGGCTRRAGSSTSPRRPRGRWRPRSCVWTRSTPRPGGRPCSRAWTGCPKGVGGRWKGAFPSTRSSPTPATPGAGTWRRPRRGGGRPAPAHAAGRVCRARQRLPPVATGVRPGRPDGGRATARVGGGQGAGDGPARGDGRRAGGGPSGQRVTTKVLAGRSFRKACRPADRGGAGGQNHPGRGRAGAVRRRRNPPARIRRAGRHAGDVPGTARRAGRGGGVRGQRQRAGAPGGGRRRADALPVRPDRPRRLARRWGRGCGGCGTPTCQRSASTRCIRRWSRC